MTIAEQTSTPKSSLRTRVKDRWFTTSEDPSQPLSLSQELNILRQIEDDAEQCEHSDCSKASWNMHVHMPVLRHAFSIHPNIRVEPAVSAKIAPSFVPTVGGRAAVIESKMIDFTLLLWLNRESPQKAVHNTVDLNADLRLMNGIAKTVWRRPVGSVNIETKTAIV
ncbi:hypothetical protein FPOAC1_007174 [Fusarium poae]|uniref:hypothetical protein n=1 Tax=Fusarium poae TaxID=36050 RepID=UPI001CEA1482|nr:hypothetical protein FPOAC1_007174 [Fusarium poae]KAG8673855.1 hypothetical protein FPOAC1_007174 [Fusarium poae]